MSRPFRPLFPAVCALLSLGFSACVGTVYDRMYSNKKTHFKAPSEGREASAEAILGSVDSTKTLPPSGLPASDSGAEMPPPAGDIPGLPPASAPTDLGTAPMTPPAL